VRGLRYGPCARAPRVASRRKLDAIALKLGTRGSSLALAQAQLVAERLDGAEIVPIRTSGDERPTLRGQSDPRPDGEAPDAPAPRGSREEHDRAAPPDKSRFVREIERVLLGGAIDLAVHSAKDLPTELPEGLRIVAVPSREDAADAFVGAADSLASVPDGARIGTSSLRRRSQLLAARPDLELVELSGNVDTRLRRLGAGEFDGIVLAAAGLRRLERASEIAFLFDSKEMTPAAGQGSLALEARTGDAETAAAVGPLTDSEALDELAAERALIGALEASCNTPVGARARRTGRRLTIEAYVGLPDGSEWVRDSVEGEPADPGVLALELAARLAAAGARELLERAEQVAA
jgi:hydroxymethylbilane synthase